MENKPNESRGGDLPACAAEFIREVVRRMRYRKKAAEDVQAELTAHFEDELHGCTNVEERQQKAQRLIEQFGDAKLLAVLCRRAKKRCRPLWATAMVRTAQGAGVMLLLFIVYTAWFVLGKPSPSTDYLALLNQMNRPQIADRDNAWPRYEKAFAALMDPNAERELVTALRRTDRPDLRGLTDLPAETQQLLTQWVAENEVAFREFAAAAAMSYCYRPYACQSDEKQGWIIHVWLPHLSEFRTLGRLAVWRSLVDLERGDVQQAIADCLAAARAGRHLQASKTLVEQLVGMALSDVGHEGILGIVHRRNLSVAELANLQRELAMLYSGRFPPVDIECERLAVLDTVQHVFTDTGPGGGHLAPASFSMLRITVLTGETTDFLATDPLATAVSLLHAGRDQTVAKANWFFDQQVKIAKLSPYEKHAAQTPGTEELLKSIPEYRYAVLYMMVPALDRVATLAFRGKAMHEATMTIVALQRYRAEKGGYPASLDELKQAGYIDALPADPYSNGPLVYKVIGDRFTLYSVGQDFRDDNGTSGKDRKGRRQMWDAQTGDAVFWPGNP